MVPEIMAPRRNGSSPDVPNCTNEQLEGFQLENARLTNQLNKTKIENAELKKRIDQLNMLKHLQILRPAQLYQQSLQNMQAAVAGTVPVPGTGTAAGPGSRGDPQNIPPPFDVEAALSLQKEDWDHHPQEKRHMQMQILAMQGEGVRKMVESKTKVVREALHSADLTAEQLPAPQNGQQNDPQQQVQQQQVHPQQVHAQQQVQVDFSSLQDTLVQNTVQLIEANRSLNDLMGSSGVQTPGLFLPSAPPSGSVTPGMQESRNY